MSQNYTKRLKNRGKTLNSIFRQVNTARCSLKRSLSFQNSFSSKFSLTVLEEHTKSCSIKNIHQLRQKAVNIYPSDTLLSEF